MANKKATATANINTNKEGNYMNINAAISAISSNEIAILKVMFGDRITIAEVPVVKIPAETKKSAPKKPATTQKKAEEKESKPTTRQEGINAYKIQKYGSLEMAAKVQEMTAVIAEEWREEAKKTGKFVVAKSEYKTKLYETAYERVLEVEAAKKKADANKSTKKTTKKSAPKQVVSHNKEELPFC